MKLSSVVDDVLDLTRPMVKPGVRRRSEVGSMLPYLLADKRRLVQILYNLISNACKFTEKVRVPE